MNNNVLNSVINAPMTRDTIKSVVEYVKLRANDGFINPLLYFAQAKFISELADSLLKNEDFKDHCLNELSKFTKGDIPTVGGMRLETRESTSYDYSNSEAWNYIKNEEERLSQIRKEIEAIAKNTSQLSYWVSPDGEEMAIKPALRRSTTSIICKIPNE
jgi:hypothetical protein